MLESIVIDNLVAQSIFQLISLGVLTYWVWIIYQWVHPSDNQHTPSDSESDDSTPLKGTDFNGNGAQQKLPLVCISDTTIEKCAPHPSKGSPKHVNLGTVEVGSQANLDDTPPLWLERVGVNEKERSLWELTDLIANNRSAVKEFSCSELLQLLSAGRLRPHQLEKELGDELKAVHIRREWLSKISKQEKALRNVPYLGYDYSFVSNSCCENVVGNIPMPLGYAGPITVNGVRHFIPMATTEGCLVASTNRGCRAVSTGEGVKSYVHQNGMTRGPVVRFKSAEEALSLKMWTQKQDNFRFMQQKFQETSRYATLKSVTCKPAGRLMFMRFNAFTGDAMGMNMVSKGTDAVLKMLAQKYFPNMEVVSLSGNYCVDKKPAALNWIEGRGKSVVCDCVIPARTVKEILKSDVGRLVGLNWDKNFVGSAVAGNLGGFNAHSANIVTAIFLATGQDAAQNISSSNCITQLEETDEGDLYMACTMPSLEVGTVGGGTILPPQQSCLEMLGCAGGNREVPGDNATKFATIIGATVLAGELSLLAALSSNDLVQSHIRLNRSCLNLKEMGAQASAEPLPVTMSVASGLNRMSRTLVETAERSVKGTPLHPQTCTKVLP